MVSMSKSFCLKLFIGRSRRLREKKTKSKGGCKVIRGSWKRLRKTRKKGKVGYLGQSLDHTFSSIEATQRAAKAVVVVTVMLHHACVLVQQT
jgi:hypothetical protein